MSLFISESKQGVSRTYQAWVGMNPPIVATNNVTSVQADGDELLKILEELEGIPKSKMLIQEWHGDIAKSVWGYWRSATNKYY